MKKLFLFLALLAISLTGFSQVTPSGHFRVATRTTPFGIKLPAGSAIYCVADSSFWEVKQHGVYSTSTLTTARDSVAHINNFTGTNTGDQTLTIGGTTSPTIALSGSNTATFAGAGITTLGQTGGTITITSTEVDGSISNEGNITVTHNSPTQAILVSNTSGSVNDTITAGTGISITGSGANGFTINSTVTGSTLITETFEESTTGSIGTQKTLAHTPITTSTGMVVSLNGYELKSSEYTSTTDKITVGIPVYKYDRVTVTYTY